MRHLTTLLPMPLILSMPAIAAAPATPGAWKRGE
jgi:hypothetical protein